MKKTTKSGAKKTSAVPTKKQAAQPSTSKKAVAKKAAPAATSVARPAGKPAARAVAKSGKKAGAANAGKKSVKKVGAPKAPKSTAFRATSTSGDGPRAETSPSPAKRSRMTPKQAAAVTETLLAMRDRLVGQIQTLKGDSLKREDAVNSEEDGTDAFDRQFNLDLATSENKAVLEIDQALRRMQEGTYGVCGECGERIEPPRLEALPFVRTCIACQSEIESGPGGFRSRSARRAVI